MVVTLMSSLCLIMRKMIFNHHFHDDDGDCDDDDNDANCKVGNFCQDKSLGGCPSVGLNYDLDIKILVLWMVRTQM